MLRKDIKKYKEDDDKVHLHLVLKGFSSFREEQKHCQKERESYSSYLDMTAKKRRERFFSLNLSILIQKMVATIMAVRLFK